MPDDVKLYTAAILGALSAEAARSPRRSENLDARMAKPGGRAPSSSDPR